MTPGDQVTVVHGIRGPNGIVGIDVCTVIKTRSDNKVLCRFPSGGDMWIDPMMIDVGNTHVTHSRRHRTGDPDTARLAANAARERLTEHQWLTLAALAAAGRKGLIDHEHQARTGLLQDSAGKRRKELERAGLCEPTDDRRETPRGSMACVHRITARGLAVWQQHESGAA